MIPSPSFTHSFPYRNTGLEPEGRSTGRHFSTGEPLAVEWRNHIITQIEPAAGDVEGWLAPPLVDLQVNGCAGIDFETNDFTLERLDACGRILLTLTTADWSEELMVRLRRARAFREKSPHLRRVIAGWHIEGPFLSEKTGFKGSHNSSVMCDPTPEHVEELRAAGGSDPILLTMAPERPGAVAAIRRARQLGIRVSFGHTDASVQDLALGIEAGGDGFTHLGNGCPQELDRHDNILWRVFERPEVMVGLIPDGIHVSPRAFRVMHRLIDWKKIYYTTDAMSAAGAPPGLYTINKIKVEVGADQVVRQPGQTNFAGSALRPWQGIARAGEMLGVSWRRLWPLASTQPARWMGLSAELAVGQLAPIWVNAGE